MLLNNQNIILIGFMASGKTSLGKKLANKLNYNFIDTDELIEKEEGKSINEIFSTYGEVYFRKLEKKYLNKLPLNHTVIAVGGGLPCFGNNMEELNKIGLTIYLKRPAKELYHRLVNAKTKRPLVKELNDEKLLDFIDNKLEERESYYLKAKIIAHRNQQELKDLLVLVNH